jgi:hypothetical protein
MVHSFFSGRMLPSLWWNYQASSSFLYGFLFLHRVVLRQQELTRVSFVPFSPDGNQECLQHSSDWRSQKRACDPK